MYRDRLTNTQTRSPEEQRLKRVMLDFHDFRHQTATEPNSKLQLELAKWQSERLKNTHHDLYQSPQYRNGLGFLLSDLYAPQDFSDRDRDLERIFPKMIKLLPSKILDTVAALVELNLLTQQLDMQLADELFNRMEQDSIDTPSYCQAYRNCENFETRSRQIMLISEVGKKLDRYARSRMISFSLNVTEKPAEMAGLAALHQFIQSGFRAFHTMRDVDRLMQIIVKRELQVLNRIYEKHPDPFNLESNTP